MSTNLEVVKIIHYHNISLDNTLLINLILFRFPFASVTNFDFGGIFTCFTVKYNLCFQLISFSVPIFQNLLIHLSTSKMAAIGTIFSLFI